MKKCNCNWSEIIFEVKDGYLSKCQCGFYFVNYKNILLEFDAREFQRFKNYLLSIDVNQWYQKKCSICEGKCRKIPIPTLQANLMLLFNKQEFRELKNLVFTNRKHTAEFLSFKDIDEHFSLN